MESSPQLLVTLAWRNGVANLTLRGELNITTVSILEERLASVRGHRDITIVDMRELTSIDSSAIGAFVEAHDRALRSGHRLILVGASPSARDVFDVTGTQFLLDDSQTARALARFAAAAGDPASGEDSNPQLETDSSPPSRDDGLGQRAAARELGEAADRELMKGICSGDADAFVALFHRHGPKAMAVANTILRQPSLAEEAVQEAFLALWRDPDRYKGELGSVRSWLMTTVHHRAVDLVRREETQRKHAVDLARHGSNDERPADPGHVVIEELDLAEEQNAVRRALEDLPPKQRQVIELMYFGSLTQARVSERLTIPLGTVKSRTLLGMRRLRAALEEERTIVHDDPSFDKV